MHSGKMANRCALFCPTSDNQNPARNGETSEVALQMRCISCGAEGRALTSNDASKSPIDAGTPTQRRRLSPGATSCHYEVAGIEPDNGFDGTCYHPPGSFFHAVCRAANALHFGGSGSHSASSADTILAILTDKDLVEVAKAWKSLASQVRESILLLVRASVQNQVSRKAGKDFGRCERQKNGLPRRAAPSFFSIRPEARSSSRSGRPP